MWILLHVELKEVGMEWRWGGGGDYRSLSYVKIISLYEKYLIHNSRKDKVAAHNSS